jgi:hypothetical protein
MLMKVLQVTDFHLATAAVSLPGTTAMTGRVIVEIDLRAMFAIKRLVGKIMSADANIVSEPDFRESGRRADCSGKGARDEQRSQPYAVHDGNSLF